MSLLRTLTLAFILAILALAQERTVTFTVTVTSTQLLLPSSSISNGQFLPLNINGWITTVVVPTSALSYQPTKPITLPPFTPVVYPDSYLPTASPIFSLIPGSLTELIPGPQPTAMPSEEMGNSMIATTFQFTFSASDIETSESSSAEQTSSTEAETNSEPIVQTIESTGSISRTLAPVTTELSSGEPSIVLSTSRIAVESDSSRTGSESPTTRTIAPYSQNSTSSTATETSVSSHGIVVSEASRTVPETTLASSTTAAEEVEDTAAPNLGSKPRDMSFKSIITLFSGLSLVLAA